MDPEGMYVLQSLRTWILALTRFRITFINYREDGVTPYLIVWKHTLSEMKV